MSDARGTDDPSEPLMAQALLYASGELDGPEEEAFERRLADDQATREALARAVRLTLPFGGSVPTRPDPAYRAGVRARLRPRGGPWAWLTATRTYRGHPAVWAALGAAAAVLLLVGVTPRRPATFPVAPHPSSFASAEGVAAAEPDGADSAADVAAAWAATHSKESLLRARDEQARRRWRARDWPRTLTGDDRPPRRPVPPLVHQ